MIAVVKGAQDAMDEEFAKLDRKTTFDWDSVQEWARIAARARRTNRKVHVGRVFGICVEKGYELPNGSEGHRYKGGYICQGNDVKDEYSDVAVFQDLSSSPANMEGAKAVCAYGCLEGHVTKQSDACQAYVQTNLKSNAEPWVELPKDWRPKTPSVYEQTPARGKAN